jgi:hypothetical protein
MIFFDLLRNLKTIDEEIFTAAAGMLNAMKNLKSRGIVEVCVVVMGPEID